MPGYQSSNGVAVNNSGDAIQYSTYLVGNGNTSTNYNNYKSAASIFHDGKLVDLGTPGSTYAYTSPTAINDSGQITGLSNPSPSSPPHAILYSDGKMVDIGTLGGQQSLGSGINDLGQVVGSSSLPGSQFVQHAFLFSGGKMTDLGTLPGPNGESEAYGINHSGQVVGESNGLAVLWNSGAIHDLNQSLSSSPPYTLVYATGINNLGQIIGEGYDREGNWNGFLLTPTDLPPPGAFTPIVAAPEPGTFAVFGLLGLGYILHRRASR
jgi:probable HAF family extracellular repeat protein